MPEKPVQLEQIQQWFWKFVVAPSGVKHALEEMSQSDPGSVPIQHWIEASHEEEAIRRLDIYANMYFFRIANILYDSDLRFLEKRRMLRQQKTFYLS